LWNLYRIEVRQKKNWKKCFLKPKKKLKEKSCEFFEWATYWNSKLYYYNINYIDYVNIITIQCVYLFHICSVISKKIDKDSYQLNPSENIGDLEMDRKFRYTFWNKFLKNVDNNIENVKDDENNIEIEEFEDADIQLYGKDFEPKVF